MRIEVVPCPGHAGAVNIVDARAGSDADPVHMSVWEWEEFTQAVKGGKFDDLARPEPC